MRMKAPRAPENAFSRNAVSPMSPGHDSAPFEASRPRRTRSRPMMRAGSPAARRISALLEPILPVAPPTTNGDFIAIFPYREGEFLVVRFFGGRRDPRSGEKGPGDPVKRVTVVSGGFLNSRRYNSIVALAAAVNLLPGPGSPGHNREAARNGPPSKSSQIAAYILLTPPAPRARPGARILQKKE